MRGQPWNKGLRLLAPPVAVLALLGPAAAGTPRPDAAPPAGPPSPDPAPSAKPRPAPRAHVSRPATVVVVQTPAPAPAAQPKPGGQSLGHVRTGHGRGTVPRPKPRRIPAQTIRLVPPAAPVLAAVRHAPDSTLAALLALAAAGAAALSGLGTVAVWRRAS